MGFPFELTWYASGPGFIIALCWLMPTDPEWWCPLKNNHNLSMQWCGFKSGSKDISCRNFDYLGGGIGWQYRCYKMVKKQLHSLENLTFRHFIWKSTFFFFQFNANQWMLTIWNGLNMQIFPVSFLTTFLDTKAIS